MLAAENEDYCAELRSHSDVKLCSTTWTKEESPSAILKTLLLGERKDETAAEQERRREHVMSSLRENVNIE